MNWTVDGATIGLVPLILTVDPSGGAESGMLPWRKPTVVKIALPIPIALTIPAAAMMTEVLLISGLGEGWVWIVVDDYDD
jgi:hypothetical protein